MRPAIRNRIFYIALFAAVTSALSLWALVRALNLTAAMRIDRGRDALNGELDRLARLPPSPSTLALAPHTSYVGLRGGWVPGAAEVDALELPPAWLSGVRQTVADAAAAGARHVSETPLDGSTLLVSAEPTSGGFAWTALAVLPSVYLQPWRWIAFGVAGATGLLVLTALWSAFSFRRDVSALHATLVALGGDVTAPVPVPSLAELGGIADGIRRLASDLVASRDATERLQRELAQKERLAALGRVAAGVAHEVRNPLASIKLRLDLTLAAHALPEPVKKAVEAASQEISRLDRLVGDLLLVAGKKMGPRRAVELGALVRARAEAISPWAQSRAISLRVAGEGQAEADPESVARAVDNLLRNAVEASPAGHTVEARIAAGADAVELCVEDDGGGVAPAREAELFEPFFTTKAEGTGLGLAISRAIARAHGGDVTYARSGEVTRFSLSLPRHAAKEAA